MKLLSENLLYFIWDQQNFIDELKTIDNQEIKVIYQGHRNSFEGPDFLNSVLKIDNKIIKGDIEIHRNSSDWYSHKHQLDSNFDSTILHVVYNHDEKNKEFTLSHNNTQIPILQLDYLISLLLGSSDLLQHIPNSFDNEIKSKWTNIFADIENPPMLNLEWNLFRIRPANHPVVRIVQIIDLVYDNFEISLFNRMLQLFSFTEETFTIKALRKELYLFFRNKNMMLHEKFKIGKSRIDTIFVNIILPITFLYAQKMSYQNLKKIVLKIYHDYPALPKNNSSKKSVILQQGLQQIWAEYCQYHQCDLCMKNKIKVLK